MLYVLAFYLLMSLLTFALYALDKRRSRRGGWRVKEQTLHLAALLGGVPGALIGASFLRHKSRKLRFRVVTILILLLHIGGWALYLLWKAGGLR